MRWLILCMFLCLSGCSSYVEVETMVYEEDTLTYDIVFGKKTRYVSALDSFGKLKCRQGTIQEDWVSPSDGWNPVVKDDITYIQQVYTEDDILLLPLDYGANTYRIVGLDITDEECESCLDTQES